MSFLECKVVIVKYIFSSEFPLLLSITHLAKESRNLGMNFTWDMIVDVHNGARTFASGKHIA